MKTNEKVKQRFWLGILVIVLVLEITTCSDGGGGGTKDDNKNGGGTFSYSGTVENLLDALKGKETDFSFVAKDTPSVIIQTVQRV